MIAHNKDRFYYIDENGEKIILSLSDFDEFIGNGSECDVYRLDDLAFKLIHTFGDNSNQEYEYFKSFTRLRNTIAPKYLLFDFRTDKFRGAVSTHIQRIERIKNFKCSSLIESFGGLLSDASVLGLNFVRTFDSFASCNYVFGEEALYSVDYGKWIIASSMGDVIEEPLDDWDQTAELVRLNRIDFAVGVAELLKCPCTVGMDAALRFSPICN